MIRSRDAESSDDTGPDAMSAALADTESSSNVTPIIIGVVVGGVAAIAITVGILFFFYKKRRWDRIQHREEHLLAYHVQAGLKETDAELAMMTGRPSSSLSIYRAPATEIHDQPPAYQSLTLPVYDPSRYKDIDIPPAVKFGAARQSILQPFDGPSSVGPSQAPRELNQPVPRAEDSSGAHLSQPSGPFFRGSTSEWPRDSIQSDSLFNANVAPIGSPSTPTQQEPRLPRRPKPVLSRLITNLN